MNVESTQKILNDVISEVAQKNYQIYKILGSF